KERNRSQSFGIANGETICLFESQHSKKAPSMTFQSPCSHACTRALLPDMKRLATYPGSLWRSCGLSLSLAGMKTRERETSSPVNGFVKVDLTTFHAPGSM